MPITGVIPQASETGMDAFLKQLQLSQENKLRQAQAENAMAEAQTHRMLANILGGGMSNGQMPSQGQSSAPMDANRALLISGALHLPTQVIEGKLITSFGTFPIGETPGQKGQREVGEAVQKKSGEKNVDITSTLNTESSGYLNSMKGYLKLNKLHKENPNLTNIKTGLSEKFKQPLKKEVGEYIGIANDIQANLARSLSQRGGAAATAQAARMKPNIWNPEGTNLGMIKANIGILNDKIESLNNEYKNIHGKDMPQYNEFKELYSSYMNEGASQGQPQNPNYSPQNLSNQAQASGEGMANVPAPPEQQQMPQQQQMSQQPPQQQNMVITTAEIQELAKKKGRPVPEIIMRLLKKGYKIEGLNNAK